MQSRQQAFLHCRHIEARSCSIVILHFMGYLFQQISVIQMETLGISEDLA
jgi:hypothetical protein